ncbi:MAG: TauD/TfdA family dioxygenase [Alphaproteobacteria bacterium]|nr:TauD/TfdA family dioxygenase [Alphaproteobacteria bacterium]
MTIGVRKCDAPLGAEIEVDLSRDLDEPAFAEVQDAFHDNIVVVFRNQRLASDKQVQFSRRFGELEIHIVKKYLLPGYPEILLVSNLKNEAGEYIGLADAGRTWHTDVSYKLKPSRCSLLYAIEVPHRDGKPLGDTLFCNTIAAYEALSEPMKKLIAGKRAIHRYSERKRIENSPRPKLTAQQLAETPDVAHPVVRTHPFTGRKSLYVTEGECIGIEGMPEDEGRAVISELHHHCIKPEFIYTHKWQVGDLLMWDNATSMHLAVADYEPHERRLMHRTTVLGGVPF